MATTKVDMLDTREKLKKAAELLRKSADAMADARTRAFEAGQLTFEEFRLNVAQEAQLRNAVAELIVQAINAGVVGVQGAQKDLESAIRRANAAIARIGEIKKALSVFARVIGLAGAIAAGQPSAIVTAVKSLKDAAAA